MSAVLRGSLVVRPEHIDEIKGSCQTHNDGHIASVELGELTIQASGDGIVNLIAALDAMKAKAVEAHEAWLAGMAEAARTGDTQPEAVSS